MPPRTLPTSHHIYHFPDPFRYTRTASYITGTRYVAVLAEPPPEKALEVGAVLYTQAYVKTHSSPVDSSDTSCLREMRKRGGLAL